MGSRHSIHNPESALCLWGSAALLSPQRPPPPPRHPRSICMGTVVRSRSCSKPAVSTAPSLQHAEPSTAPARPTPTLAVQADVHHAVLDLHVPAQVAFQVELAGAIGALEGLAARVQVHVAQQVVHTVEGLPTDLQQCSAVTGIPQPPVPAKSPAEPWGAAVQNGPQTAGGPDGSPVIPSGAAHPPTNLPHLSFPAALSAASTLAEPSVPGAVPGLPRCPAVPCT